MSTTVEIQTKNFNNIPMFKTAELSDLNGGQWVGFMEHDYNVEVKNDKARVHANSPFIDKPSRFCRLKLVKKLQGNMNVFQLTVNGFQAYFKIAHVIK